VRTQSLISITHAGALVLALVAGCASDEAQPHDEDVVAMVQPPSPLAAVEKSVANEQAEESAALASESIESQTNGAPAEAIAHAAPEYKPPFPDRVDLFIPPKRAGGAGAAKSGGENAVELMGFVRVDRPRAILAINGEISPMAVGETQAGIEVISVHPPSVVLQRGRQRWQATLE
jgi:hypothetical protein